MKKLGLLFAVLVMSFMFAVSASATLTTSIAVPASVTIYEGEIISLNPKFYPEDATDKSYTIIGEDYTYSYKGGFIGIQNKTETCKFSDYVYIINNNLIKGLKPTIEEKSDKAEKPEFEFKVTVRATDGSGVTATTTIKILTKMIDVDYKGAEEFPWYYGNSAKLSYSFHDSIKGVYAESDICFKSSNTSIATVTNDGLVTCKGVGDVTITAYTTDGKYSGRYEFYSRGIIKIENTYFENCKAGNTYQIKASILPANTSDNLIYYTSDSSVAIVDTKGLVTFKVASGRAKILVGLSSDIFNLKEVWFTSGSFKAPSGSNAQLLNHMRDTVNVIKTLKDVPGLTRYEATTMSNFTTTANKEIASSLQSMFTNDLAPRTTYFAPIHIATPNYIALRNQFLDNVPVKGRGHVIDKSLSASDIKEIKVIDNGDYYYEMKLTLKEESFTSLPSVTSNNRHGKVFDILTQEYVDEVLNKLNSSDQVSMSYNSFEQGYHDCSLTIGINKITSQIEYANYNMNIDIYISGLMIKLSNLSTTMDLSFECDNIVDIDFAVYDGNNSEHYHTFTDYISDGKATCTTDGLLIAKCDNCDATDTKPEKGTHKFSDSFAIDLDPTCTTDGQKSRHCLNCTEKTDITPIGKLAHTYNTITIDPTCTDRGHKIYTCTCGDSYTETLPALGHNFSGSACTECDYDKADSCSCNCHKTGLSALLWKILNFFYRLLRFNPTCNCGTAH